VILELKGKVGTFLSAEEVAGLDAASSAGPSNAVADAINALVVLGETRTDAERKVRAALARNKNLTTSDQIVAAAFGA
jgi:Holliday junction resolvasome RuvABC DNA-binding subunit